MCVCRCVILQVCLKYYEYEFMELACQSPAVVCCRCAPTQKAQIVRLLQERTGKLTCAVGESPRPHALLRPSNCTIDPTKQCVLPDKLSVSQDYRHTPTNGDHTHTQNKPISQTHITHAHMHTYTHTRTEITHAQTSRTHTQR